MSILLFAKRHKFELRSIALRFAFFAKPYQWHQISLQYVCPFPFLLYKLFCFVYIVVQFYRWFKFCFPLVLGIAMYDNELNTKQNKI